MAKLFLDRLQEKDNVFMVLENLPDGERCILHGMIIVQKENKRPYVYWTFYTNITYDDRSRLESEAISAYFDKKRMCY